MGADMDYRKLMEFYKGKRVLVTGHTGFKGSWMCRVLLLAGAEVCGYALEPPTEPSLFELAGLEGDGKIKSFIGDIRDYGKLKEVFDEFKPEVVLHLAAQPIVRESYKNPRYTFETNVMGTVNVCECVRLSKSAGADGYEGVRYQNVFGTYSHGPVLPKNPAFCDHLLTTALQQRYPNLELQPLDDAAELAAHNTMRDRLLKK